LHSSALLPVFWFRGTPPHPFRHRQLKPSSRSRLAGLFDRDAGDVEDLPGEEEPKTRVLPESPFKDLLLLFNRYTFAIVLANDKMIIPRFQGREPKDCIRRMNISLFLKKVRSPGMNVSGVRLRAHG